MTSTDVLFLTLKLSITLCNNICWTPELRLTEKSSSRHLKTPLGAQNNVKSSCQISSFSGSQKFRSSKNGTPLWEELLHVQAPYRRPTLCLLLCSASVPRAAERFPVLVFQVPSWSGVDIPLSAFSFFTITLFYTNNRLLCCCPLNLENKNPTPQMPGDARGLFLHTLTAGVTQPQPRSLSLSRARTP